MNRQIILLVLRSGGDFSLRDVQLIARHINGLWKSTPMPRIVCLWDKATGNYQFDGTGPGQDLAFPFGGISGDNPVVGKW